MAVSLVIHRPEDQPGVTAEQAEAMRVALRGAVWEVADTHWAVGPDTLFIATDLSPTYLLGHFRRSLAQQGCAGTGPLVVAPVGEGVASAGLPPEAEAWLREIL